MESIPLEAWQAFGAPLFLDNSAHEGGKVVSPYASAAFTPPPPGGTFGTNFC